MPPRRFLAAALTSVAVALAAASAGQPEDAVREWLDARLNAVRSIERDRQQGIVVEWSLTRQTDTPRTEIQARLRALAPFPDHPDRPLYEELLRLSRNHETWSGTVEIADSRAWLLTEQRGIGARFQAGGTDDRRWMLSTHPEGGQLTLIHSGVPFPAGFNVSRYLDLGRERVSLLIAYGLDDPAHEWSIDRLAVDAGTWTARLVTEGALTREIEGRISPDGAIAARRLTERSGEATLRTIGFDRPTSVPGLATDLPRSVTVSTPDGIVATYSLLAAHPVSRLELAERTSPPGAPEGVRIADFTNSDSPDLARYAASPSVTWTAQPETDLFDTGAIDRAWSGNPDPPEQPTDSGHLLAIVIAGVVAAIGLASFARSRRQRRSNTRRDTR